jgi:hypothetical protein
LKKKIRRQRVKVGFSLKDNRKFIYTYIQMEGRYGKNVTLSHV